MRFLTVVGVALSVTGGVAGAQQRPLDHSAYEEWKAISDERLAPDGRWVAYALTVEWGDAELVVRSTTGATEHRIARGRSPRFAADGRYVLFTIKPEFALERQARRAKTKPDQLPKDSLGVLDLASGEVVRVARVRSFRVAEEGPWVAWHLEREPADAAAPDSAAPADSTAPGPKKESETGTALVLRQLLTGAEERITDVTGYAFAESGTRFAATVSSRDGAADGVIVVSLGDTAGRRRVAEGRGTYRALAFAEAGDQLAFLTDREESGDDHPRYALYHWREGQDAARRVAGPGAAGVPAGWSPSEHATPQFSESGQRLYFGTAPVRPPVPEDTLLDDEKINVDIWHWEDAYLMPHQLEDVDQERRRTYRAVVHLRDGRVVQLAHEDMREVSMPREGDGMLAVGSAEAPYAQMISWDAPQWRDVYLVDVRSGERTLLLEKTQAFPSLSPDERYVVWWDNVAHAWMGRDLRANRTVNLTADLPPVHDEEHDAPSPPDSYGAAGWTDDGRALVYDRYDVWALDPSGRRPPFNVTDGVGRREQLRFRAIDLDADEELVAADAPLLLAAMHRDDKRQGFYRDRVAGGAPPQRLLFMERAFSTPRKADDADVLLFTRESVSEFPDLWVSGLEFADVRKLSHANPQQEEYVWATVELVEWISANGTPLQGLLYRPETFDPAREYPLMVYFYERNADNLYTHYEPYAHRSVIQPTFYASRGYVVFVPDIVYQVGYPGQSAMQSVIPGVMAVLDMGFVDPARIGVQGHSWGGYQIAYMVTQTNLFRAAAGGAPVANMTSAYGGIRWESGRSRMFQYERTQSRLGGTLWEMPLRYIENSPIFWADRVETPLLMLHNDHDGAVPWEQGIEMFTALRRLDKPAWLVNYNGEPHWPLPFQKRKDWNIRMQQFFDHYLRDAPPAEWIVRGVPALEKGRNLGLELVTDR